MKKKLKKVTTIILTFFLCTGLLPVNSLAAEKEYSESPVEKDIAGTTPEMQPDLSNEATGQTEYYTIISQTGQDSKESDDQTPESALSNNVLNQEETDENNQIFELLQEGNPQELYNDASKPADFIFVIDSTGSMKSYIDSVRSNLSSFV